MTQSRFSSPWFETAPSEPPHHEVLIYLKQCSTSHPEERLKGASRRTRVVHGFVSSLGRSIGAAQYQKPLRYKPAAFARRAPPIIGTA